MDIDHGLHWIRENLVVPTGMLAGEPFVIERWQEEWVRDAYGEKVRSAGLSVARKNGKSGLIAALLLCHLVGPWNRPQWRGAVTSLTGLLAKELRMAVEQTAFSSGVDMQLDIRLSPTPGVIHGKHGARLDFIAADKASGHAIGVDLALIDEMGLLQENQRPLVNAMFSSTSSRNGKFMGISIQGDGPMFAELEMRKDDPSVLFRRWAGPAECDLLDEDAWRDANPGLGTIKSYDYMVDAARRATSNPSDQSYFRAYDLNQNLDPSREMICSVSDWVNLYDRDCVLGGEPVVLGVDLGGSTSMSCVVAIGLESQVLRVFGAFGDSPTLLDRGRADGVDIRYTMMEAHGELRTYWGRLVPVSQFLYDVFDELEQSECRIEAVGFDRYRKAEMYQALQDAGLRIPVEARGQGASATADGSADVRSFQKLVLDQRIKCRPSLMMESAIASSTIRRDGAGNPALDKANSRGRIDALSAAVIAAGLFDRKPESEIQFQLV